METLNCLLTLTCWVLFLVRSSPESNVITLFEPLKPVVTGFEFLSCLFSVTRLNLFLHFLFQLMFGEHEVFVESSVQGCHAYFKYSTVSVGELMMCEIEENNEHDKYAVAVKNESGQIVGHVPIEISKINS